MERIGIFGGTFDPIHCGHLMLANQAAYEYKLNEVIFVPAGDPYFKTSKRNITDKYMRTAMCERALDFEGTHSLGYWEVEREGPSYTIDTIREIVRTRPNAKLYLIMGKDTLDQMNLWKDWQEIFTYTDIILAARDKSEGFLPSWLNDYHTKIHGLLFSCPYSSTEIRERVKKGQPIRYMVPDSVYNYIIDNNLYKADPYDNYMHKFDAKLHIDHITKWINDWFEKNGKGCKAVIGISGGKDSTVAAALCVKALGKDRVVGVLMPQGTQPDFDDSLRVVETLGIENYTCNIAHAVGEVKGSVESVLGTFSEQAKINLPARIRMCMLYAVSQTLGGRVVNTCNLSEDWVGYSTKYGDAAGDFSPLAQYTSDEVVAIGKELGLPDYLVEKTPADGLCEKTDEDNLGFTYRVLNKYIRTGVIEDKKIKDKIDRLHRVNLFKLRPMAYCDSRIVIEADN